MSVADARDSRDDSDSPHTNDEMILSRGLLDIRLQRLMKQLLGTPFSDEIMATVRAKAPENTPVGEKMAIIMRKVYDMEMASKVQLLKEATFIKLRAFCERSVWHTYKLSGEETVTSPRGRRKIARRIERQLDNTVEVMVDLFDDGVWIVLFSRNQLANLMKANKRVTVSVVVFVWYKGEAALYSSHRNCPNRQLLAVGTTLGFGKVRQIGLWGRHLSSMRLMFTAKQDRRFYDNSIPGDDYPLMF